MSTYRIIGALNVMPDHFVEVAENSCPTITGSIRRGIIDREVKDRCCYLEVQKIDGDEYDVVDSWSCPDSRILG